MPAFNAFMLYHAVSVERSTKCTCFQSSINSIVKRAVIQDNLKFLFEQPKQWKRQATVLIQYSLN